LCSYFSKKKLNFLAPISLRQELSQDSKISNILVAVDGSENSIKAADYAIKLALGLHGRVIALYVVLPPGKQTPDKILTRGTQGEYDFLDKLGQKYNSADVKLEIDVITSDSVVSEITNYAEKKNIDIIVIGIRSTSEFRFMLGSTASGVVTNSPCPVLVVK
jgi:nucleotide-binding universal stress UspA family protein